MVIQAYTPLLPRSADPGEGAVLPVPAEMVRFYNTLRRGSITECVCTKYVCTKRSSKVHKTQESLKIINLTKTSSNFFKTVNKKLFNT